MHRRTAELLATLDRHHEELVRAFEDVPVDHRDRRPGADRWSVANVLEHLALVEARIGQALTRGFAEARAAGLPPAPDTSVVGDGDAARYLDRERRIVSNNASQPTAGLDAATAWATLQRTREATRGLLLDTDGLDVEIVTLPHPVFGALNFYQWMVFIGGHEGRHALQIQEVGRALSAGS